MEANIGCLASSATNLPKSTLPTSKEEDKFDFDLGTTQFGQDQDASLFVGKCQLSEMASAYEKTEPTSSTSTTPRVYDVISNNCTLFLMNLATEMGVTVDSPVVSFAARRLFEQSGRNLASRIRSSVNYLPLIGCGGGGTRNHNGVSA